MLAPRNIAGALAKAAASTALVVSIGFATTPRAAETTHEKMHEKMPSSGAEFMKMDPAECWMMMDHDHNGKVSKKEYMKFQEDLFKKMAKKDQNSLTREEWLGQIHSSP